MNHIDISTVAWWFELNKPRRRYIVWNKLHVERRIDCFTAEALQKIINGIHSIKLHWHKAVSRQSPMHWPSLLYAT